MKKEWRTFLTAIMFLTRIRVPAFVHQGGGTMQQAPRYFPVVGWIVGGITALVYLFLSRTISTDMGILGSMIAGLLVTGAIHEDGWADVCDGFGGGWTREKILLIMKDSRIGAFGAIGLFSILATKFLLLKELPPPHWIFAVISAHSLSRLMPVLVMYAGKYASDPDQSKAPSLMGHSLSLPVLGVAIPGALLPFVFLPPLFLLAVPPALMITYFMYRYFNKWIGGYTGDCLGAVQQVTEIVLYLGFIVVWRYL